MHPKKITFSVNSYDGDGDETDVGVFLHFEGARVKAADSIADFRAIVDHMEAMSREIEENYAPRADARPNGPVEAGPTVPRWTSPRTGG